MWLFLDDDVLLEPDFIEKILEPYSDGVAGVSGIVTNYSAPPALQRWWERIFLHGPFYDERQTVYRAAQELRASEPVKVRQFGGGLMSFKAKAIRHMQFDENLTGACPGEDVEFCAWLKGKNLVINPKARLIHNRTETSRDETHWIAVDAQVAAYMRKRHWKGLWAGICYAWLNAGYFALTGFSAAKKRSLGPLKAWRAGVRRGKALAQSTSSLEQRPMEQRSRYTAMPARPPGNS